MSKLSPVGCETAGIHEYIDISKIRVSPRSIRDQYDKNDNLVHSISNMGLLQPILVRMIQDNNLFEIVAGVRRYRACRVLGWRRIACNVVELDEKEAFEISLVENIQRESLLPLEEAIAFKTYVTEFGWGSVSELASKISKSASYVTKRIMLLDLPEDVIQSIRDQSISVSLAEELFSVKDSQDRSDLASLISDNQLTVKKVRILLKNRTVDNLVNHFKSESEQLRIHRTLDNTIVAIRLAMNRIGLLIENMEDNWVIHEILMQHRKVLHDQIDLIIKQKRKYVSNNLDSYVPMVNSPLAI